MAKVTKKSYLTEILGIIVRFLVKVERNIWWHFGISMPLYSYYWKCVSENRQVELAPIAEKVKETVRKRMEERWPEPIIVNVKGVNA